MQCRINCTVSECCNCSWNLRLSSASCYRGDEQCDPRHLSELRMRGSWASSLYRGVFRAD
jgi:hypothetical protein